MSTRCNIIVIGPRKRQIVLYHHHDGYPERVGRDLRKLCEAFNSNPYYNPEAASIANMLVKNKYDERFQCIIDDEDYEASTGIHGDIEFLYKVFCHPYNRRGKYRYFVAAYSTRPFSENPTYERVEIPDV